MPFALGKNPEGAKPHVIKFLKKHLRPNADLTTKMCLFGGINPTMAKRLNRVYNWFIGFRPLGNPDSVRELKNKHIPKTFTSLVIEKIKMLKKVSGKRKARQ